MFLPLKISFFPAHFCLDWCSKDDFSNLLFLSTSSTTQLAIFQLEKKFCILLTMSCNTVKVFTDMGDNYSQKVEEFCKVIFFKITHNFVMLEHLPSVLTLSRWTTEILSCCSSISLVIVSEVFCIWLWIMTGI